MCITVKQMMQIEENGHQMGFSRKFMMENAGAATVKVLYEKFSTHLDITSSGKGRVLVFAGLGNNGGDGLVIARHLAGYGLNVTVFLLGEPDNIRSEGITKGAIQIPADGLPIVLLTDYPTIGGYPKIANVTSVDYNYLIQKTPGEKIFFELIKLREAEQLYKEHLNSISEL